MYTLSLGFLIGTLSLLLFQELPPLTLLYLLIFIIPAMFFAWNRPAIRAMCAALLGFLYALYVAHGIIDHRIPTEFEGKTLQITGQVINIPEKQGHDIRFYFDIEKTSLKDQAIPFKGKIKIGWYRHAPEQLKSGEVWQLDVRLKRPSGFMNTGGFDYEKWLFRESVLATGYVRKSDNNQRLAQASSWRLDAIRESVQQQINKHVDNKTVAAILNALSVAVRSDISNEQWEVFRNTGTSHLIAISGLHVGMVAGFAVLPISLLWMLFPSLYLKMPVRTAVLIMGAVFATIYALLAGFTIPTQRALVMVLFAVFSLLLKRKIPLSYVLATALFAVLLLDPLAGLSQGFWLSFFSVSLIFYLLSQSYKALPYKLLRVQLLLSFGMIPITAAFFGTASLVSPIANFLAIPWVTLLIVPAVLIALPLLYLAPALSDYPLALATWAVEVLLNYLHHLSTLSFSIMQFAELPSYIVIGAVLGVLILALPQGLAGRWLGFVFIFPLFFYAPEQPSENEFKLTVLDVGQGLATVVQTEYHVLVFDTGERYSKSFDVGNIVVLPYLQSQNINSIDKLIISHLDKDHSGGAAVIIKKLPVIQLLSSEATTIQHRQTMLCQAGQKWTWDGVEFQFLSPSELQGEFSQNNRSCVLKIRNQQHSLLLLADIEKPAEQWLIHNQKQNLAADVLLVPHHGSKTSSSPAFLQAVKPKLAIVSVGYRNRFHFPSQKVIKRYQQHQIPVLSTIDQGEVQVKFPATDSDVIVQAKRIKDQRYWHR